MLFKVKFFRVAYKSNAFKAKQISFKYNFKLQAKS